MRGLAKNRRSGLDEILADTLPKQLSWLSRERGLNVVASAIDGPHLRDVVGATHYSALKAAMHAPDFIADLAVMPRAREVMATLCRQHEVYVATAAMDFPRVVRRQIPVAEALFPLYRALANRLLWR